MSKPQENISKINNDKITNPPTTDTIIFLIISLLFIIPFSPVKSVPVK